MNYTDALDKARAKRDQACYLAETLKSPGLVKIWDEIADWLSLVIYLAEKGLEALQEEPNEPLTEEELHRMYGKPVYIVQGDVSWWDIVKWASPEYVYTEVEGSLLVSECGKEWVAYRHKPKEG